MNRWCIGTCCVLEDTESGNRVTEFSRGRLLAVAQDDLGGQGAPIRVVRKVGNGDPGCEFIEFRRTDSVVDFGQSQLGQSGVIHRQSDRRLADPGQDFIKGDRLCQTIALDNVHIYWCVHRVLGRRGNAATSHI